MHRVPYRTEKAYLAEMGMPLLIKVQIIHNKKANVYVATSPDLKGLVVEAETLD